MPEYDVSTVVGREVLRRTCKESFYAGYKYTSDSWEGKIITAFPQALDYIDQLEAVVKKMKTGAKINCQGIDRLKKEIERLKNVAQEQSKDYTRLLNETGKGLWT